MELSNMSIEKLVELKNTIDGMIRSYDDGHVYICKVSSYGGIWTENVKNVYELEELCMRYNGDDGIVDVYTTNPNVSFHNYGNLMYIESREDYDSWYEYQQLKSMVPRIKKELDEWDNRDNVPFNQRPMFTPAHTRETLAKYERMLDEYDMSFVPPKPIHVYDDEEA
jgi:hypothetical protein